MNCARFKGRADEHPAKAQRAPRSPKGIGKLFVGTEVVHNPVKEFVPLKEVKVGQEVCIAELISLGPCSPCRTKTATCWFVLASSRRSPPQGAETAGKARSGNRSPKPRRAAALFPPDRRRQPSEWPGRARPAFREDGVQPAGSDRRRGTAEVDSFIDRAILNGQTVVYLIHGNGTGALRTAIHKHLRGNRMVKSFRLGRYGEGESGVTVVN